MSHFTKVVTLIHCVSVGYVKSLVIMGNMLLCTYLCHTTVLKQLSCHVWTLGGSIAQLWAFRWLWVSSLGNMTFACIFSVNQTFCTIVIPVLSILLLWEAPYALFLPPSISYNFIYSLPMVKAMMSLIHTV